MFSLLTPTPGAQGVCKRRIFVCMVLFVQFPLIWYAKWLLLVKTLFDLSTLPQVERKCKNRKCSCTVLFYGSIPFNLICNISTFREKCFDFDPTPGIEGLHVAAFVIPFNLICNMTIFWNYSWILTIWFYPQGRGVWVQKSCYHVAACVISFNLICNILSKSCIVASFLPHKST